MIEQDLTKATSTVTTGVMSSFAELAAKQLEERHPATLALLRFFDKIEPASSPQQLDQIRAACKTTAVLMIVSVPDGPELTTGLRKLLEAKDCFVRGAL